MRVAIKGSVRLKMAKKEFPMKRKQIKLGGVYCANVSGKLVDIVITDESRYGGWTATNMPIKKVKIWSHSGGVWMARAYTRAGGGKMYQTTQPNLAHACNWAALHFAVHPRLIHVVPCQ